MDRSCPLASANQIVSSFLAFEKQEHLIRSRQLLPERPEVPEARSPSHSSAPMSSSVPKMNECLPCSRSARLDILTLSIGSHLSYHYCEVID